MPEKVNQDKARTGHGAPRTPLGAPRHGGGYPNPHHKPGKRS